MMAIIIIIELSFILYSCSYGVTIVTVIIILSIEHWNACVEADADVAQHLPGWPKF